QTLGDSLFFDGLRRDLMWAIVYNQADDRLAEIWWKMLNGEKVPGCFAEGDDETGLYGILHIPNISVEDAIKALSYFLRKIYHRYLEDKDEYIQKASWIMTYELQKIFSAETHSEILRGFQEAVQKGELPEWVLKFASLEAIQKLTQDS